MHFYRCMSRVCIDLTKKNKNLISMVPNTLLIKTLKGYESSEHCKKSGIKDFW